MLVLGAGGMLGHKLVQRLGARFECRGTVRSAAADYEQFGIIDTSRLIGGVDAANFETVLAAIGRVRPSVVINCIGILKQLPAAKNPIATLQVNALFPQRLALLCEAAGAWLVHISTDCVFSGRKGAYTETDTPDAEDLYGRTKLLGEPEGPSTLVLRTSMIGRELQSRVGLVEWLVAQRGQRVKGFRKARFSGLTTAAIADLAGDLIGRPARLTGLFHLGTDGIDKYDLLCRLNEALGLEATIEVDDSLAIDRTLNSSPFWQTTGLTRPRWTEMIDALAEDTTPYDEFRRQRASTA